MQTDEQNYQSVNGTFGLLYQPSFNLKTSLNFDLGSHDAKDTLLALNPEFFKEGSPELQYLTIGPTFRLDRRDVRGYARSGYLIDVEARYTNFVGLSSMNFFSFQGRWINHLPISKNLGIASATGFKISPEKHRPYYQNRGIGWDMNTIRGFDLFVVDGNSYLYEKYLYGVKHLIK